MSIQRETQVIKIQVNKICQGLGSAKGKVKRKKETPCLVKLPENETLK